MSSEKCPQLALFLFKGYIYCRKAHLCLGNSFILPPAPITTLIPSPNSDTLGKRAYEEFISEFFCTWSREGDQGAVSPTVLWGAGRQLILTIHSSASGSFTCKDRTSGISVVPRSRAWPAPRRVPALLGTGAAPGGGDTDPESDGVWRGAGPQGRAQQRRARGLRRRRAEPGTACRKGPRLRNKERPYQGAQSRCDGCPRPRGFSRALNRAGCPLGDAGGRSRERAWVSTGTGAGAPGRDPLPCGPVSPHRVPGTRPPPGVGALTCTKAASAKKAAMSPLQARHRPGAQRPAAGAIGRGLGAGRGGVVVSGFRGVSGVWLRI